MNTVKELMQQQMTRKDFVRFIIAAIVALLGWSNFIALLNKTQKQQTGEVKAGTGHGFGSRKFGA